MATEVIEGTAEVIQDIVALDAAEAGLPREGTPVGPGPHGPVDASPGRGWTLRRVEAELVPNKPGRLQLDVDGVLEELPARLASKNPAAAAKVAAAIATKKTKAEAASPAELPGKVTK